MPTISHNRSMWNDVYDWPAAGEEWSVTWGGSGEQWYRALLPRIIRFLPVSTILEIGPGYGRWTHYLQSRCDRMTLVDVTPNCIAACRERFANLGHIDYHVNDGQSLEMVPDHSIDFVFSFDSLVHAEEDAVAAYLEQIAAKLTPNGVGVIHHSNLGQYRSLRLLAGCIPDSLVQRRTRSDRWLALPFTEGRAPSVSADSVLRVCARSGLSCIGQEQIAWRYPGFLLDCITVFTLPGSPWDQPFRRVRNRSFPNEAREARRQRLVYGRIGVPDPVQFRAAASSESHPLG